MGSARWSGAAAALFAAAVFTAAPLAAHAQSILRVGIVTALTGAWAAPGKFQMNGFKLAVEDLNSGDGVRIGGKPYKIELDVFDTRCNAAEGSLAIQKFATVEDVPVVLGELCTPVALAEGPLANENELPFINTVAGSPTITDMHLPYVFRVNANQAQTTAGLAKFVGQGQMSPLAFLAWNNDSGRAGVNLMKGMLPPDFKVAYVGYFNIGDVDFRAQISNMRASGAKSVMLLMDEEPGSLAIRQIRESGLDIQIIGSLAMGSDRFLERLDAKTLDGMIQYNTFPPNADVPRIKRFADRYRATYHEEAHGWAANSTDGLMVAIDAMKRAGTTTDRAKIRDALAATKWSGVAGPIAFDANGQADTPVYVTQWCGDGTRRILYPPEYVAGCGKG